MIDKSEQEIMRNWSESAYEPVVSICMITYNHEKFIKEALDGCLMQETDFPFEIIVDDDCSSDKTGEIIRTYAKKFPHIMNIRIREQNVGSMINFLENMKRARGQYIALCEGDDYWIDPLKLQTQVGLMKMNKYKNCNISFHPAYSVIDTTLTDRKYANHYHENTVISTEDMIKNIGGIFCPTASLLVVREAIVPYLDCFADAPVGDDFIQYFGSFNGGALFIASTMSVYRTAHAGAYNTIIKKQNENSRELFIKNKEEYTKKYINTLENIKKIINEKYHPHIDQKIARKLLDLSIVYLHSSEYRKFKITIEDSYKTSLLDSPIQNILFRFRKFPKSIEKVHRKLTDPKIINKYKKLKNISKRLKK